MNALTRRSLFGLREARDTAPRWSHIAEARDCAPGTVKVVSLEGCSLRLESLGEGLRLVDATGDGRALELRSGGELYGCVSMRWPRTRLLAHATGEPREFEDVD